MEWGSSSRCCPSRRRGLQPLGGGLFFGTGRELLAANRCPCGRSVTVSVSKTPSYVLTLSPWGVYSEKRASNSMPLSSTPLLRIRPPAGRGPRGKIGEVPLLKLNVRRENVKRNAPRLTGGTPAATRRRKLAVG